MAGEGEDNKNEVVLEDQGQTQTVEPDDGLNPEERAAFDDMRAPDVGLGDKQPVIEGGEGADKGEADKKGATEPGAKDEDGDEGDDDGATGTDATGDRRPKRVSWAKHERELKAREDRIATLEAAEKTNREMQARLDERMKIINEALTPKEKADQEDDDPEPDADSEIFEHNKWLRRQLVKTNQALGELHRGMQQQGEQTNFERAYLNDVQRFATQEPNFQPAYNFLMEKRIEQLALLYFDKDVSVQEDNTRHATLTPQELQRIQKTVEDEEETLVGDAIKQNVSPAQRLYKLARSLGYRPAAAKAAAPDAGAANGAANGAAKAAGTGNGAAKAATGETVLDEVSRIKKGVESSVSLSGGGGAPARTITPEVLANMPQDEFDELIERLGGTDSPKVKQLLGGA